MSGKPGPAQVLVDGYKLCSVCNVSLVLSDFGVNRSKKTGLDSACKSCRNKRAREQRESSPRPSGVHRARYLRLAYGMSEADYQRILDSQYGVCAICHRPESLAGVSLSVDHNHATGKVRGLLCGRCNRALGSVKEDVRLLRLMADYLNSDGRREYFDSDWIPPLV